MKFKKLLFLGFLLTGLLVYISCRKLDTISQYKPHSESTLEKKFFNSNRTADPTEKALVDFLKSKNNKEHFVEQTIKQIGFPRWDKTVTTEAKNRIAGRGNSDSSLTTYYIPFVRDSQNFVNASMVIKAFPSDTTFSYKCDWQYSERQNNVNSYADSSEYYAIFFMVLNKAVFGHSTFEITDSTLFRYNNNKPIKIQLNSLNVGGRGNLLEPITVCQEVTIFFQYCPYIASTLSCYGTGGACDNCLECLNTTDILTYQYCWTEWIETGGGGGGTGGTGGNGGGGGSTPPTGSTPPDCGGQTAPFAGRTHLIDPCTGGWEPIPIEDEYDSDFDPLSYPESPQILLFEQDYRAQMSAQELLIFDNLPRLLQLQYLFNAKSALDLTQTLYPSSVHNGNGDAFRHAYFSALNAKVLGVPLAKQLGDAHETFPNSNPLENEMDLFNNQYGRDLFIYLSQNGMGGSFFKETVIGTLRNHRIPNGELKKLSPLGFNSEILPNSQLVPTD